MILRALGGFVAFWFDFVVGDDWRIATGVVGLVGGGALVVHLEIVSASVVAIAIGAAVVGLTTASILIDARRMRSR